MGPRLVGRGKVLAMRIPYMTPIASMGPRLVGRGKVAPRLADGAEGVGASMGPRLVGRGKTLSLDNPVMLQ